VVPAGRSALATFAAMNHEGREATKVLADRLSFDVIGAAIEVHRRLSPGLLESVYERCLARELQLRGIPYQREVDVPVVYRGEPIGCGYRVDFVIDECLLVELKASAGIAPIHQAQLLTYLRLKHLPLGLIINFNVQILRSGIRRLICD
jgi:GxxExxY protein